MKEINSELEVFEVHVSSNRKFIEYLSDQNLEYLHIHMLDKDKNFFMEDFMSSIEYKCRNLDEARQYASSFLDSGFPIHRIKIESPPLEKYFDKAIYIERHWKSDGIEYPLSFIPAKDKYVATEREYKKSKFREFAEKYPKTELCLLDSNIKHDEKWFDLWN